MEELSIVGNFICDTREVRKSHFKNRTEVGGGQRMIITLDSENETQETKI